MESYKPDHVIIHWLYYCTVNVYVTHFCNSGLFFLSENKSVYHSLFLLFIHICIAVEDYQERGWVLLTGLTLQHFSACPKPGPEFP